MSDHHRDTQGTDLSDRRVMSPISVWLVDEGTPGHRVQSEGVLDALQREGLALSITRIPCTTKLPGFFRPLARCAMTVAGRYWPLQIAKRITEFQLPKAPIPSFIISSGGRSAYLNRALSCWTGSPNVYVGVPDPFPGRWFNVIMPPVEWSIAGTTVIPTGVIPSPVTPLKCRAAASQYWNGNVPANCWTLLIGGNSPSHRYESQDWKGIISCVNALSRKYGIKWLLSTSRRTGTSTEQLIQDLLDPQAVQECTFASTNPKKVVLPYLGSAHVVFVTQDSRTMVSEAVLSGRPVVIVAPEKAQILGDINSATFQHVTSMQQVVRIKATELTTYATHADPGRDYEEATIEMSKAVGALRRNLGL